jgi:superkiller protein 3
MPLYLLLALWCTAAALVPRASCGFDTDSDMAYRYYKEGLKAENNEKYARAVNAFYHVTLMDPDYALAYRCIGRIYVKKQLFKDALDSLKQALFLDQYDPETHYYLGVVYPIVEHNSAKAIKHFKEYLKLNPPDPDKIKKVKKFIQKLQRMGDVKRDEGLIKAYNTGAEFMNKGKLAEAVAAYKKAIEMNPHYAPAHEGLGLTYIKMKKFEAALKEFKESLMINPYAAESHYGLGVVYPIVRDDYDKAIKHFKKYLELSPNAADAGKVRGWIANLNEKKAARRGEAAFYNKGVEAFDRGDYAGARSFYQQAIGKNPNYFEAYHGLGLALVQLKQYEAARKAFEDAIDVNPDYAEAHYGLGVVYPLLGNKMKAATHFWKYLELKPNAPDIKQVMKWIEQLEGA